MENDVAHPWICLNVRQWWTDERVYKTLYSEINTARVGLVPFNLQSSA